MGVKHKVSITFSDARYALVERWANEHDVPLSYVVGMATALGLRQIAEYLDDDEGRALAYAAYNAWRGVLNQKNPSALILSGEPAPSDDLTKI